MNKQEAIKELKAKKDKNERLFELEDWDEGFKCGAGEALNDAIFIVKQLDEPEKPVVPQFVADWYEDNKGDIENSIFDYSFNWDNQDTSSFGKWFSENDNKPIQTLMNMHQFGYEVEKEKLYTVEIPNPNDSVHTILHRTEKGIIISYSTDENYKNIKQNQLTEAEIKQDFEWAWQFAKEVDE